MNKKDENQRDFNASFQSKQQYFIPRDVTLGFAERAFSAAGAAVLSAVLVNPLDVAKVCIHLPHFYPVRLFYSSFIM